VHVHGDEAVAVCESLVVRHRDGSYGVWRAGANHFHLHRERDGWRITHRTTRALNGSTEARELLRKGALGLALGSAR
jgi:hypothetical protein